MLTFNLQKYDLENAKLMLDVGCGEGRHIFGVMQEFPDIKCIGIDMDASSLIKAEEGYEYFKSLSKKEVEDEKYIKGVTCKYCFDNLSNDQKKRFSQRQNQIELSLSRGEAHIGQTKKTK